MTFYRVSGGVLGPGRDHTYIYIIYMHVCVHISIDFKSLIATKDQQISVQTWHFNPENQKTKCVDMLGRFCFVFFFDFVQSLASRLAKPAESKGFIVFSASSKSFRTCFCLDETRKRCQFCLLFVGAENKA